MVLEKTLESLLDCKEMQPVNTKEINPDYSLEGLMLKLKFQYFDYLMQIDGETVTFCFLGSQITADGDCSHEIKRHLLFEGKVMANLDSILKNRDITLPKKSI